MSKKIVLCLLALVFVLSTSLPCFAADGKTVIKVGIPLPLSGAMQNSGTLCKAGAEGALEYFKEHGGFVKHPEYDVEFDYADLQSDASIATTVAEKLINEDKVQVLVGGYAGKLIAPMAQLAIKYQVPFLVSPGVPNSITATDNDYVYRANAGDALQTLTYLEFFKYLNTVKPIKNVGYVGLNDETGSSGRALFLTVFDSIGAKLVVDESVQSGVADMSGVVQKIKANKVDLVVVYLTLNEALLFQRQMKEYKCNAAVFSRGAGYLDSTFLSSAGNTADYVFSSTQWTAKTVDFLGDEAHKWYTRINELAGMEMNEASACMWLATSVMLQALDNAETPDAEGIKNAIAATDLPQDNWALMWQVWYDGVKFEDNVENSWYNVNLSARSQLSQVLNGQWTPVYPTALFGGDANSPIVYPIP